MGGGWTWRRGCGGAGWDDPVCLQCRQLGPAHTSSMEQIGLVWVKRLFFQPISRHHAERCLRCAWRYLCDPGWGWWAVLISFLFFFSLGVAAHNDGDDACEEMLFPWLLWGGWEAAAPGCAVCPRAFCALAHVVLPWLILEELVSGTGWPLRCCQPPPWLGQPLCSHSSPWAPWNPRALFPKTQGAKPRPEQHPRPERGRAAFASLHPSKGPSETPVLCEGQQRQRGKANPACAVALLLQGVLGSPLR